MKDDPFAQRIAGLASQFQLKLVMVFGSQARGGAGSESDLDLAVWGEEGIDLLALTNAFIRTLHYNEVDLVDLRRANPLICFEALRTGKVLHEDPPGTFAEVYSLAMRRYEDTRKLREARRLSVDEFLSSRGLL